jgi:hypothetical protein
MAGVAEPWKLNEVKSAEEACRIIGKPEYAPGITYARVFAEEDGRGPKEEAAFDALVQAMGAGQASSVRAECWFLYWGSYTGNTLNGILGRKAGKPLSLPFKLFMLVFYGPLFAEIALVSKIVSVLPVVPAAIGSGFGAILSINAGIWFIPVGLFAILGGVSSTVSVKSE